MSITIMQNLTFIIITASKKIATLKFLPYTDTWLASWPNTDRYIGLHFACESRKKKTNRDGQQQMQKYVTSNRDKSSNL